MAGLREVATRITRTGISCSVWVDGSFLTEKIDPWDVDLVAFIPARFYDDGAPEQLAVVDWLTSRDNEPRKLYRCDTHAEPMYPELAPFHYMVAGALDYWRNTYGRSVGGGAPKGIAVLELVGDAQ